MRAPGRNGIHDLLYVVSGEAETPLPASSVQRVMQHLRIRFPRSQHFVETISREILDKRIDRGFGDAISEQALGKLANSEIS